MLPPLVCCPPHQVISDRSVHKCSDKQNALLLRGTGEYPLLALAGVRNPRELVPLVCFEAYVASLNHPFRSSQEACSLDANERRGVNVHIN